jgi:hypothetical protein
MKRLALVVLVLLLFVASILAVNSGGAAPKNIPSALLVPRIVAQVSLTGQTQLIPQTSVFSPPKDGLFRIAPYLDVLNQSGSNNFAMTLWFTDNGGSEHGYLLCGNTDLSNSLGYASICNGGGPFIFRAVAGSQIYFDVEGGPFNPPFTYDMFFTIEQLN